jgi:hypothetical protein
MDKVKNSVPILDNKSFQELWLNKLTEQQKITRIKKAWAVISALAEKQLYLLKQIKEADIEKSIRFLYFINTINNVWDNADFILALGKGRNRRYAFYPTRSILETIFRLEHFTRQKKEGQDDIATREILRINKRMYEQELADSGDGAKFIEFYQFFAKNGNYPNIQDANPNDDPFPSMRKMAETSKIEGGSKWYPEYQVLAELTHGKLMAKIITDLDERAEYRRCLMYLIPMCNEALKIMDFHLGNKTQSEVIKVIKQAEAIVKKPL